MFTHKVQVDPLEPPRVVTLQVVIRQPGLNPLRVGVLEVSRTVGGYAFRTEAEAGAAWSQIIDVSLDIAPDFGQVSEVGA